MTSADIILLFRCNLRENINFASRPYFSFCWKLEQGNVLDDDASFITLFLVSFNLQSCSLQSGVCSLQSAVCILQSGVCSLESAVWSLQSAVCKCHTP